MISKNVVLMEELPYHKLETLGISKADVLAFPKAVLEPLLSGRVTPVLMTTIKRSDGSLAGVPIKLQVTRDNNNAVDIVAYPLRKEILNDLNLSRSDIERLKEGEVVRKEVNENNTRTHRYYQLDHETQSVMHKSATSLRLAERIKEIEKIGHIELGLEQKKAIHEGKPVQLDVGDKAVTVGVDLKQANGFTRLQGDMQAWEHSKAIEFDRLNPGVMGYVHTEQNRWEYQQVLQSLQPKAETQQSISMKAAR